MAMHARHTLHSSLQSWKSMALYNKDLKAKAVLLNAMYVRHMLSSSLQGWKVAAHMRRQQTQKVGIISITSTPSRIPMQVCPALNAGSLVQW